MPSAAHVVMDAFPSLQQDPIVQDIVFHLDLVDTSGKVNGEPEQVRQKREMMNQLSELNQPTAEQVRVVTLKRGPWQVTEFLYNIGMENDEIDDETKMRAGLLAFKHWYAQEKRRRAGIEPMLVDRVFFDKVCALYLQLTIESLWVFETDMAEIMARFNALTENPGMNFYQTVMANSPIELDNQLFREIEAMVALYRAEGRVVTESAETIALKERLTAELAEFNRIYPDHQLAPVTLCRGPREIVEMIPSGSSETAQVLLGLLMLRAWWHKKTSAKR